MGSCKLLSLVKKCLFNENDLLAYQLANKMLEPLPLEIFGRWQTGPYVPPTAENGIVPRNAYGNVELFKPEMLPKKTVHLRCKRLMFSDIKFKINFSFFPL